MYGDRFLDKNGKKSWDSYDDIYDIKGTLISISGDVV